LSGHLLPGLEPKGVPKSLKNTIFPFQYNDFKKLKEIVTNYDIGTIKMEVQRSEVPKNNFLEKVRALATKKNIVLIFDECTSGFRETFGGLHLKYDVSPDIAVFGKTLGNGYAISAIIGTQSTMESAQTSFISSTFWTERIGPSAALKTLEIMEKEKSWEKITNIGNNIKKNWHKISQSHNLNIECTGLPALASFSFTGKNSLLYKTFLTQEFLKNDMLASNSIYASTTHEDNHLKEYFRLLETIFSTIKMCENEIKDINSLVEGPSCHGSFKRLN
jgi:glutamate-1-semialdehyde aminotransferase